MIPSGPLAAFILEVFPTAMERFGEDCWFWEAIREDEDTYGEAILSVTAAKARPSLKKKIRKTHPPHSSHLYDHDDRMHDVFVEAEAFAWAREVALLGDPVFITKDGCPDLRVGERWIEAKHAGPPAAERALVRRQGYAIARFPDLQDPKESLWRRIRGHTAKALCQWRKQSMSGSLTLFLRVEGLGGGSWRKRNEGILREWAASLEQRHSRVLIVICSRSNWRSPLYAA